MENVLLYSDDGTTITKVSDYEIEELVIPDGVTTISVNALDGLERLKNIYIPKSVINLGDSPLMYCFYLENITVESGNASYCSIDGVLCNADATTLIRVPENTPLLHYEVPDSVKRIENNAFDCCESMLSITIPEGVSWIGESAFQECVSLQRITIPESVKYIGQYAFYHCCELQSIDLPDDIITIGESTFCQCSSLKSVKLPKNLQTIEDDAFCECESLQDMDLLEGLQYIGFMSFCCWNLLQVHLPESIKSIGDSSFFNDSKLECINIPMGVMYIGEGVLAHCNSLNRIECQIENLDHVTIRPDAFKDFNTDLCTLYVPYGKVENYRQHPILGQFKNIQYR